MAQILAALIAVLCEKIEHTSFLVHCNMNYQLTVNWSR